MSEAWFVFHINMMIIESDEEREKKRKEKCIVLKKYPFIFLGRPNEPGRGMNQTMKTKHLRITPS
jgi:hypothetical protein